MSVELISALIGLLGVLTGSALTYYGTRHLEQKRISKEHLIRSVSAFYLAYANYCAESSDENLSAMLATADSVRLFFPAEHLKAIDNMLYSFKASNHDTKKMGSAYSAFRDLCRKVLN